MADQGQNKDTVVVGEVAFRHFPFSRVLAFALSTLLDVEHPTGKDGKQFLEEFGYPYRDIRFLYERVARPVVAALLENNVGMQQMKKIVEVLKKMERDDCVDTIRKTIIRKANPGVDVDADINVVLNWSADVLPGIQVFDDKSDYGAESLGKSVKTNQTERSRLPPPRLSQVLLPKAETDSDCSQQSKTDNSENTQQRQETKEPLMLEYEPSVNKQNEDVKVVLANGYVEEQAEPEDVPDDPWTLPTTPSDGDSNWNDLTYGQKIRYASFGIAQVVFVIFVLYLFICSLDLLSISLHLIAGKLFETAMVFPQSKSLNPVSALMIGLIVSYVLPSSSTAISVITTMAASDIITIRNAIFMLMGRSVGMCLTNALISFYTVCNRREFSRIFGGASLYHVFNILTVLIVFVLEMMTGFSYMLSGAIIRHWQVRSNACNPAANGWPDISRAFIGMFIEGNCNVTEIDETPDITFNISESTPLSNHCIPANVKSERLSEDWFGVLALTSTNDWTLHSCGYRVFSRISLNGFLPSLLVLLLIVSALVWSLMFVIMRMLGKLQKPHHVVHQFCKRVICSMSCRLRLGMAILAVISGAVLTVLLQSSVKVTAVFLLLLAVNTIELYTFYRLAAGATVGEAIFSILYAKMNAGMTPIPMQLAICHLIISITGLLICFTLPCGRKIVMKNGLTIGRTVYRHRWLTVIYVLGFFLIIPGITIALAEAGQSYLYAVGVPVLLSLAVIYIINILQRKAPGCLPIYLQTWEFLPQWMHSLEAFEKCVKHLCHIKCQSQGDPPPASTDIELENT
ncbi:sodium-dependent phosphate transport protein 2A-like [Ptychodera flava]|uniref:sodium-dependent phosphate transport protein 2A-like n=1 Tax=Ptychodera flava TaxID=63121 RepID=UPI00396A1910